MADTNAIAATARSYLAALDEVQRAEQALRRRVTRSEPPESVELAAKQLGRAHAHLASLRDELIDASFIAQ